MTNFFIRDEEQKLAEASTNMDDIDILIDTDGKMVVVAMRAGQHVCQRCEEPIAMYHSNPKLNGVPFQFGGTRLLLHPNCHNKKRQISIWDNIRGMQVRRKIAQVAKDTQGLEDVAQGNRKRVVAG